MSICHFATMNQVESGPVVIQENWDPTLELGNSSNDQSVTYTESNRLATMAAFNTTSSVSLAGGLARDTERRYIEFELVTGQVAVVTTPLNVSLIEEGRTPTLNSPGDVDGTRIAGFKMESLSTIGADGEWVRSFLNEQQFSNGFKTSYSVSGDVLGLEIDFVSRDVSVYNDGVLQATVSGALPANLYGSLRPHIVLPQIGATLWSVRLNQREGEFANLIPLGAIAWAGEDFIGQLAAIAAPNVTDMSVGVTSAANTMAAGEWSAWTMDTTITSENGLQGNIVTSSNDLFTDRYLVEIWGDDGTGLARHVQSSAQALPTVAFSPASLGLTSAFFVIRNDTVASRTVTVTVNFS